MLARTAIGAPFPEQPEPDETHILIVSAHFWIAQAVIDNLQEQGKTVNWVTNAWQAELYLASATYDLCIADASTLFATVLQVIHAADRAAIRPRLNIIGIPTDLREKVVMFLNNGDEYSIQ